MHNIKTQSVGFYAGSFDPITLGHVNIAERASGFLKKLIIGIGVHHKKYALLDQEQRRDLIIRVLTPIMEKNTCTLDVISFDGLAVTAAQEKGASILIRGLRDENDFSVEKRMALMNAQLNPEIQTLFLVADHQFSHISSTLVRQIAKLKGELSPFVPEPVVLTLKNMSVKK